MAYTSTRPSPAWPLAPLDPAALPESPEVRALLLAEEEVVALERRCVQLLERGSFPHPEVPHPYPWPLL